MPNRSNMRSSRGSNDVVKAGDAARATEAGSNLCEDESSSHVVAISNGGAVINPPPLRPGDAAQANQAIPNLFMVTIKYLDGTSKTVLKSQAVQNATSCHELTRDQLSALFLMGQADLYGDRGAMTAVLRSRVGLFFLATPKSPFNFYRPQDFDPRVGLFFLASPKSPVNFYRSQDLDRPQDLDLQHAKRVALSIYTNAGTFLPLDTFNAFEDTDTPEVREEKKRRQIQANCSIPADVLDAALNGDEAIVKMMLEKNLGYLLYRGTATDFSGHSYTNLTPFQAALITGDEKMVEMMKPFFARLKDGEEKMQNQVEEIFPHGIKAHFAAQKRKSDTEFVPMLDELIAVIKNAFRKVIPNPHYCGSRPEMRWDDSILLPALKKFKVAFTNLSRSEKIFNPHYLLAVFEAYPNKFDWSVTFEVNYCKPLRFSSDVIGFVLRFLPATYAQDLEFSQDRRKTAKHLCPRSFNFTAGLEYMFGPGYVTQDGRLLEVRPPECLAGPFSKLISNKNSRLLELIAPREQSRFAAPV